MRIQILPLPPLTLGDATETPFVVVFDRLDDPISMDEVAALRDMATAWGAKHSLSVGGGDSIEISPHLEIPDDLHQQLIAHLTSATKENP